MNTTTAPTISSQGTAPLASPRIRHPRIASAIDESRLMLTAGSSANLLLVCGPTGVGKSTLGSFLVEREFQAQAEVLAADPGCIPAIRVEAPASGEDEFSWPTYYERILIALEGDLDIPRTAYGVDPVTGRVVRPAGPLSNRPGSLRTAVERSLRHRRTRFIVVDEAAHIVQGCSLKKLVRQLNTLKSLSNLCGVQWILLGSYDLFDLILLSAQVARRSHVIHFSRYREDVSEDVGAFRGCLKKLAGGMAALQGVDLLRYTPLFHQNTLGCVGTLRDVLTRLDLLVAEQGWSEETLRKALLTEAQVTQILREIVEGEERIAPALTRSLHTHEARVA